MKWDRERLSEIVSDEVDALEKLIEGVRAEAIGWTWTEACSQYSKGMNPGDQNVPELLAKALLDLNPERK